MCWAVPSFFSYAHTPSKPTRETINKLHDVMPHVHGVMILNHYFVRGRFGNVSFSRHTYNTYVTCPLSSWFFISALAFLIFNDGRLLAHGVAVRYYLCIQYNIHHLCVHTHTVRFLSNQSSQTWIFLDLELHRNPRKTIS